MGSLVLQANIVQQEPVSHVRAVQQVPTRTRQGNHLVHLVLLVRTSPVWAPLNAIVVVQANTLLMEALHACIVRRVCIQRAQAIPSVRIVVLENIAMLDPRAVHLAAKTPIVTPLPQHLAQPARRARTLLLLILLARQCVWMIATLTDYQVASPCRRPQTREGGLLFNGLNCPDN